MKQKMIKGLFLLFCLSKSYTMNAQRIEMQQSLSPQDAVAMASEQLSTMLSLIEPEDMEQYGFSTTDDYYNTTLGKPFYLTTLPVDATPNKNVVMQNHAIMVPVMIENKTRCFIYLGKEFEKWQVVGIGGHNYVNMMPALYQEPTAENGTSHIQVVLPQAGQEYIYQAERNTFLPIIQYNESEERNAITLDELIAVNKQAVETSKLAPHNTLLAQPQNEIK